MNDAYARAPMMTPPRLMGVQLRPYSAWHIHVLCLLGNPVVIGGRVSLAHAVQVLLVCADEWHADQRRNLRTYRAFMRPGLTRARMWLRALFCNEQRLIEDVIGYTSAYLQGPTYWQSSEGDGRVSRIPVPCRVVGCLIAGTTVSETRAWNMPFTLALAYKSVNDEMMGARIADADLEEAERILGDVPAAELSGVN